MELYGIYSRVLFSVFVVRTNHFHSWIWSIYK